MSVDLALDRHLARRLVEHSARLLALGRALEAHRDLGLDDFVEADLLEIDVGDDVAHRVELQLLDDGVVRALLALEGHSRTALRPASVDIASRRCAGSTANITAALPWP